MVMVIPVKTKREQYGDTCDNQESSMVMPVTTRESKESSMVIPVTTKRERAVW